MVKDMFYFMVVNNFTEFSHDLAGFQVLHNIKILSLISTFLYIIFFISQRKFNIKNG